jgi:hypothetical protein
MAHRLDSICFSVIGSWHFRPEFRAASYGQQSIGGLREWVTKAGDETKSSKNGFAAAGMRHENCLSFRSDIFELHLHLNGFPSQGSLGQQSCRHLQQVAVRLLFPILRATCLC